MVETQEDSVETSTKGIVICCPKCGSKNVTLRESKEGYFWIYLCNNCGYKGEEGKPLGCIDKKNEPTYIRGEGEE